MVAVPRCLRATRVRLLRRARAPHGIARWTHRARSRARIGTRPRRSAARAQLAACARPQHRWRTRAARV